MSGIIVIPMIHSWQYFLFFKIMILMSEIFRAYDWFCATTINTAMEVMKLP